VMLRECGCFIGFGSRESSEKRLFSISHTSLRHLF
jgi:hypothetical protein